MTIKNKLSKQTATDLFRDGMISANLALHGHLRGRILSFVGKERTPESDAALAELKDLILRVKNGLGELGYFEDD